ncbi:MAG: SBBP repeat-containing protein [Spirochaetes bacterium]|nr:SBBP repeat-containing protein [Spirochaetota bacterium]
MKYRLYIFIIFFISALNPLFSQVIIWTQQYDGGTNDQAFGIAVDLYLNAYVTGRKHNGTDHDYFTIKYDKDGNTVWTQQKDGGNGDDMAYDICIDPFENIYITGSKRNGAGNNNFFTVKYSTSGVIIWTQQQWFGISSGFASGIDVDPYQNVYLTGYRVTNSNYDFFTIKYDPSGNTIWTQIWNSGGNYDIGKGITVDKDLNVYVVGDKGMIADWVIIKYDPSGTSIWTQYHNSGPMSEDWANGVVVDSMGNIYVTGQKRLGDNRDFFTKKYDSSGSTVWTQQYETGKSYEYAKDIAIDSYDCIYVTGMKSNEFNLDFFTIKYDSDGNTVWTQQFDGGIGHDIPNGITVDREHNVYVAGEKFNGTDQDYLTIKIQQPPYVPSLTSAVLVSEDSIRLSWLDIPNENQYIIYRSLDGVNFSELTMANKDSTGYVDTALEPDTKYFYRIATTNAAGKSLPSNILQAQTTVYSIGQVIMAPNPFIPQSEDDLLSIFNLPFDFELNVYSTGGSEVARIDTSSINGKYLWDVKNKNREPLKSGVYICYFKDKKGNSKSLKLVVVR